MHSPPSRHIFVDRFKNKVALVTGATHGIGFSIALELLKEGANVVAAGLPADVEEGKVAFAAEGYDNILIISGDLSSSIFCTELVSTVIERFGRVDLLVNNAFSFLSRGIDSTTSDWDRVMSVGPVAFALLTQLCAAQMKNNGGGSIVNISSISAWVAQPNRWTYNCAKGAVAQLTRCAALDLAPLGIRVNSVSPGWTWTREVDKACNGDRESKIREWGAYSMLERLAFTIEIARPVLFLLSDDASFITGSDLPVDGGYNALGPEGLGRASSFAGTK
jgi:NAD(P)-dependent dehydrogenase (short-subunit alcohol dehydrogenase family)